MAALNPLTRELVFKLVFYGPGLGGKTTTLQFIHGATKPENRGNMVSLATPNERTLYFDFLPLRVQRIRGLTVRLQLFTVPGQVYYGATRKLVLTGADGVVFVGDSQAPRLEANQESLEDLTANLVEHGRSLSEVPHTFQWNKRDIPDVTPLAELDRRFNLFSVPSVATVATSGEGIFEGLELITRRVLEAYRATVPSSPSGSIALLEADDVGIADAVRGLAEAGHGSGPSTGKAGVPRAAGSQPMPTLSPGAGPSISIAPDPGRPITPPPVSPVANAARPITPPPISAPGTPAVAGAAQAVPRAAPIGAPSAAPSGPSFSLAALWPEAERDGVRRAEWLLGVGDLAGAVQACDLLLTRVLASAAGLVGPIDAPRDPASVCLLLGLDGTRYLEFRHVVRRATVVEASRSQPPLTPQQALEALLFCVEARRARDRIRT